MAVEPNVSMPGWCNTSSCQEGLFITHPMTTTLMCVFSSLLLIMLDTFDGRLVGAVTMRHRFQRARPTPC
jgi:hypothetical protein